MRPLLLLLAAAGLLVACHDPAATTADAGPVTECSPGEAARACGPEGSGCRQACSAEGTWAHCNPESGPADEQHDAKNCGGCGIVCPAPAHAGAVCAAGKCARGPCAPGYFDLDGATTPGCEAQCEGSRCTLGDGSTVQLASAPLPESGLTAQAFASGSSYGTFVQTSAGHTNIAILGESTPTSPGTVEQRGTTLRNVAGFSATQTR